MAGNETVQSTAGVLQAKGTELVDKAKQSDIANKVKSTVGSKDKGVTDTTVVTTYETTTPTATTDLFEPSGSSDPLTDPLTGDPLRPANVNGTNNI